MLRSLRQDVDLSSLARCRVLVQSCAVCRAGGEPDSRGRGPAEVSATASLVAIEKQSVWPAAVQLMSSLSQHEVQPDTTLELTVHGLLFSRFCHRCCPNATCASSMDTVRPKDCCKCSDAGGTIWRRMAASFKSLQGQCRSQHAAGQSRLQYCSLLFRRASHVGAGTSHVTRNACGSSDA